VSPNVKDYSLSGTPNATVTYKSQSQATFIKVASLNIFLAHGCEWELLGAVKVKEGQKIYLPPKSFLQIDVHLGNISAISPYTEHSAVFYRFHTKSSQQYILEIINGTRSHGFEVYSLDAKGANKEVPYESLAKDCH
jgi:hypothetical protein